MNAFEDVLTRLLPIFSNLMFLWSASRYIADGDKDRGFLYLFVALFTSPVYHLCMGFPNTCFWSVYKYHVVDFWTAVLSIPLTALMFVRFRDKSAERWLILISVIAVGLIVTADSNFVGHVIIAAVSLGIVAVYVLWHRRVHGYWPQYDTLQLVLGVCFCAMGVCFFIVQDWWPPYYGYTHSYWHTLVAIGVGFFSGIRYPPTTIEIATMHVVHAAVVKASIVANNAIGRVAPFTVPTWRNQFQKDIEKSSVVLPTTASAVPVTVTKAVEKPSGFSSFFEFAPMDGGKYVQK